MRNMYTLFTGAMVLFLACCITGNSATAQEENIQEEKKTALTHLIRVNYKTGIHGSKTVIAPGTTVVWFNESESLIEVQFTSKQVTLVCSSPVNFVLDIDGTFVSNKIPMGALASICFIEKGTFDYTVRNVSRNVSGKEKDTIFKGRVSVQ